MYKDTSIFQGITQYKDSSGTEWKFEEDGATFKFYVLENDNWHYQGAMKKTKGNIAYIHSKFINSQQS
jgi:hypothetical protein